ncbi:2-hydroxyglutaryl-CoA dehydratase [Polyangium jinanense]|uniref:2-hydroxyglutaryl-CoA dehydratase n=1 Tax=Polyangium jinanense TaxID=2829994 RepID=A0A9X4ARP0_9BACT|nr:2-hydroxyglutaryl-CoA dehydratase [Polyangium jinanense]MDC3955637.1 2-hydroxyglutaryl-CoA dehydratase [Polyangium jinanense]MDC3982279.1 2-hydroxyglutaryl-CoA dehydratase [Polyangium jinanense]
METAVQRTRLPIMNGGAKQSVVDEALEAELRAFEEAERERLGIKADRKQWVDSMLNPQVKRAERENVTLLISGLTAAQDFLVEGALGGLGYKIKNIGCPDQEGLQVGKEFGNRGQCNPTYFTVGNLVNYLIKLRDEQGLTSEEVVKNYVFLTAGACGPCRFGMYVTEYRKALRDAGFDGFRVMLFQQTGGLSQATGDDVGIDMNPAFFVGIVKGIVCGDVLNALGYRIRPYEVVPGATNKALEEAKRIIYKSLHDQTNVFVALYKCRKLFEAIEVDRLRVRAKASIIGEFWAMTTEGDGNYQLQKFLESEGAENDIQLTTAWLLYNVWEVRHDTQDREVLRGVDEGTMGLKDHQGEFDVAKRIATMRLAEAALKVGFQAFAQPIGLHDYHLPDMDLVAQVAEDYYSNDLRGGEGHMEVGKLIVNTVRAKAHITVSVKPFGCMPSSGVSDGVQSLITGKYPGTIFCAVETSGDGAANFYSRIQMYMFKARIAAEQELERVLAEEGVTIEEVRAFLDANPKYKSALYYPPHRVAGTAANLVYVVAPLIKKSAAERAIDKAKHAAEVLREAAVNAPGTIAEVYRKATNPETIAKAREDALVLRDIVRGKAMVRFRPLLEQLMGKAVFENNPEIRTTTYEPIAAE